MDALNLLFGRRIGIICSDHIAPSLHEFLCFLSSNNIVSWIIVSSISQIPRVSGGGLTQKGKQFELDLIILVYPLVEDYQETTYNLLSALENKFPHVINLSWPRRDIFQHLYPKVEFIYKKAIGVSPSIIMMNNEKYKEAIGDAVEFYLASNNGTRISFSRKGKQIICENCNLDQENIIELPGGEIFFPIDNANGNIVINGQDYIVKDNRIKLRAPNGEEFSVFCEFGLGTNPFLPYIPFLDVQEKALKTCHFGFGNNLSFGGDIDIPYHFDVTLPSFSLYAEGHVVEL